MRYVHPFDLPDVWEFVERGLKAILTHGDCWWTPADVRRHLLEGRCSLFVTEGGFVTLERCAYPNGVPFLNVWHMYFEPGKGVKRKRELIDWLDQVTKETKCSTWQFSGREEWRGMIEGECELVTTTWRRKK